MKVTFRRTAVEGVDGAERQPGETIPVTVGGVLLCVGRLIDVTGADDGSSDVTFEVADAFNHWIIGRSPTVVRSRDAFESTAGSHVEDHLELVYPA